jgi:hypothetical protein
MTARRVSCAAGFSVVEVLVATMIALMLAAAVVAALTAHGSASRAQPAAIDLVQRARAAVAVVEADLLLAGAGVDEGPAAGGLVCCLPPVTPRRVGLLGADSPGTARPDVITVAFVPLGATASTLAAPLVGGVPLLTLAPAPPCPPGAPACGMPDGSAVLVFDRRDYHDYFRLSAPPGVPATLTPRQSGPWAAFDIGAVVSPVETHTYYFDAVRRQRHAARIPTTAGRCRQLFVRQCRPTMALGCGFVWWSRGPGRSAPVRVPRWPVVRSR